ncbi:MAG: molybdopterin-dependent oxidoreductase, partial [Pyrinomonadaceae bacterium]|nr:molybdopterin-dependent oxidoreductase [Pyrinomonadaceae bacterium]
MKNIDSHSHVRGESVYLDDIPVVRGTLYACVFDSPVAHGKLVSIDTSGAEASEGVVRIISAKDIIGENQIGGIVPDEPLLADGEVHFAGQPIAIVLAETEDLARKAAKKVIVDIEPLPVVTDPRVAAANGDLIVPPKKFVLGNIEDAFANCTHVFEGKTEQNGQEHLYIETQGAYALPTENGGLKIYSSTQGPTAVQRAVCRVTGLPMHKVEVDVQRLG